MTRVSRSSALRNLSKREIADEFEVLRKALNELDPKNNFRLVREEVVTPAPDTEFEVTHNLEHEPSLWFVNPLDGAVVLWKGDTEWTADTAYFKADTEGVTVEVVLL